MSLENKIFLSKEKVDFVLFFLVLYGGILK